MKKREECYKSLGIGPLSKTRTAQLIHRPATSFYDSAGNFCIIDAKSQKTSFGGNPAAGVTVTGPLGHTSTYYSSASGLMTGFKDPLGHTWSYGYDGNYNLTDVWDPNGGRTSYQYDDNGNMTKKEIKVDSNASDDIVQNYTYDTVELFRIRQLREFHG
ncbi:MAG: hypothetical protein ABSC17_11170, partial [Thermacetogeniaceae bacterium]